MRILSSLKYDIKFQFRHGFYYAYLVMTTLYIFALQMVPPSIKESLAVLIVFSDPCILGFMFIGGIILLEKDQKIFENLFVTPLEIREYILTKMISFSFLALITSLAIIIATFGFNFRLFPLLPGIILSSFFFTLLGFTMAVRMNSLNQFIIIAPAFLIIFAFPLFDYFRIIKSPIFYLFPSHASIILINGAFNSLSALEFLYSSLYLLLFIYLAYKLAYSSFDKYIIQKIGNGGN